MAGRILTIQRQARELGRLRSGHTDTSGRKPRPVRSDTWIVTSPAQHYVEAAAAEWGGTVQPWQPLGSGAAQYRVITEAVAIDAIMPPGDPLSQSYESWSRGGCARRCDGETELLSDRPCLCRAQHGDDWWQQPKDAVCQATTRLNVILPQMPDVGVWRMETHSHWAANEIAAHVDLIRSATRGEHAVPIRLRIEQRQRVANGQTKRFPVVAVELRGITAGQVLAGTVLGAVTGSAPAAAIGPSPAALEAAPSADARRDMTDEERTTVLEAIADTTTVDEVRALWEALTTTYPLRRDDPVCQAMTARAAALGADQPVGDMDELWRRILTRVPGDWTTTQVEQDFQRVTGVPVERATTQHMQTYLTGRA